MLGVWVQDEVLLVEHTRDDGSKAQIVYRAGGGVDADALQDLCAKVALPCAGPVRLFWPQKLPWHACWCQTTLSGGRTFSSLVTARQAAADMHVLSYVQ